MKQVQEGMSFEMAAHILNENLNEVISSCGLPFGLVYYQLKNIVDNMTVQYMNLIKQEENKATQTEASVEQKEEEVQ